jgi:hypothetical protein
MGYAITRIVPRHVEEVRAQRLAFVEKTEREVKARLTKEISYWDRRAQDLKDKERAGKRTLVVRMGRSEAVRLLRAAFTMVFAITIAGILWGGAPWGCVALFLFLPACEKVCRLLKTASKPESFEAASGRAVFIHALGGLILCLAYAAPQIVKGLP